MREEKKIKQILENFRQQLLKRATGKQTKVSSSSSNSSKKKLNIPDKICRAEQYIYQHLYEKDLDTKKIMEYCHTHSNDFSTKFHFYIGETPKRYILILRMKASKLILLDEALNEMPIVFIARYLGFSGKGAFNHFFKKYYGLPPQKWRQDKLALL
ncbi:MAG TPA: helix-turn-helix domain-containing protein [Balneolaceae bacterium]|nr:helix-turn-helix domain-containing protein [Balneolaceae bacterium]